MSDTSPAGTPETPPPLASSTPEVQPLVAALNGLVNKLDDKTKSIITDQQAMFTDFMKQQSEALTTVLSKIGQVPAPAQASPAAPAQAGTEVNIAPIIVRLLDSRETVFRDKVVALSHIFPKSGG